MIRIQPACLARAGLLLMVAFGLAGCALGAGDSRYRLIEPQIEPAERSTDPGARRLAVARPEADQTRDATRILVRRDRSLMPWAGAAWIDRAPDLFQGLLVDFLDGRWGTVGRYGSLPAAHRVDLVLERFELVDGADGLVAEVAVTARLFDAGGQLLGVSRPASQVPVASGDSLDAAMHAIERASRTVFVELAGWLDTRIPLTEP